jgi:hypothetical protein
MFSPRLQALRGMTGLPLGIIPREDPEDVLSSVPFLPPEIPQGFYEEMLKAALGQWEKTENFIPGMALPIDKDEDEFEMDLGEDPSGFV